MLFPHCTEGIPHCTEYPLQHWVISRMYWFIPGMYWIPSTVLKLSPCCTDVIPLMYWCYPPLYWTASTVLKVTPTALKLSLKCTAVNPPPPTPHTHISHQNQSWINARCIFLPPLGIKDNAKFSIAFVIKIFVMFFSIRQFLYYNIAEILKKLWTKM